MTHVIKTQLSEVQPGQVMLRGYNLVELAQKKSFGDVVYLLFAGELPQGAEGKMIETMLICCVDHSASAPSAQVARSVASCGVPLQSAVAAGISAMGEHHGGAGEACARFLQEAIAQYADLPVEAIAEKVIQEMQKKGQRLPGYGHRLHEADPRTQLLLNRAKEWRIAGRHIQLAEAIEARFVTLTGKHLPLNVDGALAAVCSDLHIHWQFAKALFLIARSAGLSAQVQEEFCTGKPLGFFPETVIEYEGPERRAVPDL